MKRALFTALIALTSTACITEESEPATAADGGVQADGAAPDGAAPDARPHGCDAPNPSEPACTDNSDCGANQICQQVPGCEPSSCECVDGGWLCTEDCGPVMGCVNVGMPGRCPDDFACADGQVCEDGACVAAPPACDEANLCPPGSECEDGECVALGAPCQRDFDCPNSACDTDTGECLPACPSDPEAPLCDALPPVCPSGTSLVATQGCYDCQDPAAECASAPNETCWGAFQDPDGVCLGANDGVLPAECCQMAHYRHQRGVVEPSCAPDDGPAAALKFSLGDRACGDQPRADLTLLVWAPQDQLRGETFGLAQGQAGGMAQFCDLDQCEVAMGGEITFDAVSDYELTGRYWVRFGDEAYEASFQVESCGELPFPGCG